MKKKWISYRLLKNIYIFVFSLYLIFYLLFIGTLFEFGPFGTYYLVLFTVWQCYAVFLFLLFIIIGIVIVYIIENRSISRKQISIIVLLTSIIIVLFIPIKFLLDWAIPIFSLIISA